MNTQELARLFVEATVDALMAVYLPEGRVHFVNPAFTGITGFARDEVEGEYVTFLSSLAADSDTRDRPIDLEMLKTPGFYNDIALPTREGQTRFVTVKVQHAQIENKNIALVVISDDTERQLLVRDLTAKHQSLEYAYQDLERMHTELKFTQEKIIQASKLVALGELAAGMSHELNQPLTGIRGFAQEILDLLRTDPKPSKKNVSKLATWIVGNADKMATLLSGLRNFARQDRSAVDSNAPLESVSIPKAVNDVQILLGRTLEKQQVSFEARGIDTQLTAWGRAHPLEQILINLVTNSRDAVLARKTQDTSFKGKILVTAGQDGDYSWIRVTDNGSGIPDNIRTRIFDPFFSTKETGQGMGLGLSISFGLAHKMGGELTLESSGRSGTTFVLKLPRSGVVAARREAA